MKSLLTAIVLLLMMNSVNAQTWEEWTRQKRTQRKYLVQQIAALQVYLGYAKKGYDIAEKGLTTITKIKKGDFDLHDEFFTSLKKVNPNVAASVKVDAIITKQIQIIKESKKTIVGAGESGAFTSEEMNHCQKVFETMLASCIEVIDELIVLTTSGELQMKDDERIKRIVALYVDMQSKYAFTVSFSNEMGLLALQRVNGQTEIDYSKKIKGGL